MAVANVLNEERFLPPRLPGLSLWLDAQDTSTLPSLSELGTVAVNTTWATGFTGIQSGVSLSTDETILYSLTYNSGIISRVILSSGTVTSPWVTTGLTSARTMIMGKDGNLYILDATLNTLTQVITSTGVVNTNWTTGLSLSFFFTQGMDSNFYAVNTGNGTISQISPTGIMLNAAWASGLTTNARAIVQGNDGNFYITTTGRTIIQVSSTGIILNSSWVSGLLTDLRGISIGKDGNFYVTGYSAGTIIRISPTGLVINTSFAIGLTFPYQIAFTSTGTFYVSSTSVSSIARITGGNTMYWKDKSSSSNNFFTLSGTPVLSNTLTNQPSVFLPKNAQMMSGLYANFPTINAPSIVSYTISSIVTSGTTTLTLSTVSGQDLINPVDITFTLTGGGGGGGGGFGPAFNDIYSGGGGGQGGTVTTTINTILPATITYTLNLGAGGAGGAGATTGSNGGNSTFIFGGTTYTAGGGGGGSGAVYGITAPGGIGGSGTIPGYSGGNGSASGGAAKASTNGGGGGGSGGVNTGGGGGGPGGGNGGSNANGQNALAFSGAGGGGGGANSIYSGGAGASGVLTITAKGYGVSLVPGSRSIFMVYQCPQTSSSMRFSTGNDISGQAFGLAQSNGVVYSPYQYGYGDTTWSVTPNTYIVPSVVSAIYDASATMIRGDHAFNSFLDVRETSFASVISNTPYVLGASTLSSSVFTSSNFHVCEILSYNRALATTDRQMIEGYLAWKWGMTTQLPNGHPYQKFPPTGEQVVATSTPSNLFSGLVSWLDMADSTTYTLSGNTTTLKTLTDKVGGGSFSISGSVSVSTIGTLPSLNFTGNNSATLQTGGFLSKTLTVPPEGCAIAILLPAGYQLAAPKLGVFGWGSPGNNSSNPAIGYTLQSSTSLGSYNTGNGTFYGPTISLSVSQPAILFWAWYGGNMFYLSSNGNTVLSSPQTTGFYTPTSTNNLFYIGNDGGFGASFKLGELCVYNSYLEAPFRNIVEGYLAWKWGIQSNLPVFHPYSFSSPTLQTITEVNALSQPTDISGLTLWLDAGDTTIVQQVNPTVTMTGSPLLLGVSNGYTYYAFKGNGTVTSTTPVQIQYFAVGGGGGGGFDYGAGGGAGGLQTNTLVYTYPSQVSNIIPLVPKAVYSVIIGAGGAYQTSGAAPNQGSPGGNTTFTGTGIAITANGGGGGGQGNFGVGQNGGCGGGGGYPYSISTPGGTGNQGGNGVTGVLGYWGGAGGGIGGNATGIKPLNGGIGLPFFGTYYGGGGGGAAYSLTAVGIGGSGVGGTGGYGNLNTTSGYVLGIPPVANSGGGGGGGGGLGTGTAGAAGIFIIGIPLTQTVWSDKSPVSNSLFSTSIPQPVSTNFGTPARPSIYFGPGASATSIYNSGADSRQFSAFLVASIPASSYLLVTTGQLTTGSTGVAGQTFGFYASNGLPSVLSPLVVQGTGANNNAVGNYSTISGKTFELFACVNGTTLSGNMNYTAPLTSVNNTATSIPASRWVFGNCIGDSLPKLFHVHEFITYNRPVTTLERQMIEGYLYWKWQA